MQPENQPTDPSAPADAASPLPPLTAADPTAPAAAAATPAAPTPAAATITEGGAPAPATSRGFVGPDVGETVAFTAFDPYDDVEVTRYGITVAQHPADPNDPASTDRVEIAWLPAGTAVLPVADLDAL